jgi:hypothetical protein
VIVALSGEVLQVIRDGIPKLEQNPRSHLAGPPIVSRQRGEKRRSGYSQGQATKDVDASPRLDRCDSHICQGFHEDGGRVSACRPPAAWDHLVGVPPV